MVVNTKVLSCRGCGEYSILETLVENSGDESTGDGQTQTTYKPPRLWRRPPSWLSDLEVMDSDFKGLLDEVYLATHDNQTRLLSMGVRSVLDRVMILFLGGDVGTFQEKLKKMVDEGHLTERQAKNIEVVIDAGSASTHRGFRPPRALIEEMVVVMENMVRDHYITGPMLQTARDRIPPRPPRERMNNRQQ